MIIGIDIGGTNLDGVVIENKKVIKTIKKFVDRNDLFSTIYNSLLELLENLDKTKIKRINLSTTVTTNAIVENKLKDVLMLVQSGPGINNKFEETFNNLEYLDGYVDHRGKIIKEFNLGYLEKIKDKYSHIENLSVVTKFSTRNPQTENKIKDYFKEDFKYTSLGHSLSGNLNFPRRVNTAYLNSAVADIFINFIKNLKNSLEREGIYCPIYILKADGGTLSLEDSLKRPVETTLSGPSASFMGITALESTNKDALYLDIGGTTTDIFFLVDGSPLFNSIGLEINNLNTLVRGIYSYSIGLGGDSSIDIKNKEIKIGPERKDKPLALGGKYPTVTDAFIILGLLKIGDKEKSIKGLTTILENSTYDVSLNEFSEIILERFSEIIFNKVNELLEDINSKPLYTVKEVLENRKIFPKEIKIIGGPSEILAPYIERKFNIKTSTPKYSNIANAIGATLSKPTLEANLIADTKTKKLSIPEFNIFKVTFWLSIVNLYHSIISCVLFMVI